MRDLKGAKKAMAATPHVIEGNTVRCLLFTIDTLAHVGPYIFHQITK